MPKKSGLPDLTFGKNHQTSAIKFPVDSIAKKGNDDLDLTKLISN